MASLRTFGYQGRQALSNLRSAGLMNVATISTISITLVILGGFLLFMRNVNHVMAGLRSQLQITLFLDDDAGAAARDRLIEVLQADVAVERLAFIPREEALERMKRDLGDASLEFPHNPLPDSFEVQMRERADLDAFLERCRQAPAVAEIASGQEWVRTLKEVLDLTRLVGLILVLVLGTASLLIVANTIKLTVYARRAEIGVMQLVGATAWFIRTPFLMEGFLQGLLGGAIALAVLLGSYHLLVERVASIAPFLSLVRSPFELVRLSVQLLCMGGILGLLGSLVSLRKVQV